MKKVAEEATGQVLDPGWEAHLPTLVLLTAPSPTTISSPWPPLLSFLGLPNLPSFLPSHALKPEPGGLPCLASSCPEEKNPLPGVQGWAEGWEECPEGGKVATSLGLKVQGWDEGKKLQQPSFRPHLLLDCFLPATCPREGRGREVSLLQLSACISKSGLTGELEGARRGRSRCANPKVPTGTATSLFPAFLRGSYWKERLEGRQREAGAGGGGGGV